MIKREQLVNSTQQWRANGRYKVNTVVTYNGVDYQNTTGANSNPESGIDWEQLFKVVNDLVTGGDKSALSAEQGVVLKGLIDSVVVNLTLFPTTADSDISGYKKLVDSMDSPDYDEPAVDVSTGAISTSDVLVASLASEVGVRFSGTGVRNLTINGNIKKVSGTANGQFYFKVYKRDLAGTETLLATSDVTTVVSNTSYAEFTASAVWSNTASNETDRIIYKFYGSKSGAGSNPTFNFQFGGASPVRSTVPVSGATQAGGEVYEVKISQYGKVYQSDGELVVGRKYFIYPFQEGDDFSNVGAENYNFYEFVATGTTPLNWSNGTTLIYNHEPLITVTKDTLKDSSVVNESQQLGFFRFAFDVPNGKKLTAYTNSSLNGDLLPYENVCCFVGDNNKVFIELKRIKIFEGELTHESIYLFEEFNLKCSIN